MPLIHGKSDRAFKQNIKTEMKEGKDMKQSLAIAYNLKRKAQKMAKGGDVEMAKQDAEMSGGKYLPHMEEDEVSQPQDVIGKFAQGGEAMKTRRERALEAAMGMLNQHGEHEEGPEGTEDDSSVPFERTISHPLENQHDKEDMVGKIMKQRMHTYAQGGEVEEKEHSDDLADFDENDFDRLDQESAPSSADYTDASSGDEDGDKGEDMRRKDMISQIMRSRKLKDRLPSPR